MFSAGETRRKSPERPEYFVLPDAIDPEQVRFESCAIRMDD